VWCAVVGAPRAPPRRVYPPDGRVLRQKPLHESAIAREEPVRPYLALIFLLGIFRLQRNSALRRHEAAGGGELLRIHRSMRNAQQPTSNNQRPTELRVAASASSPWTLRGGRWALVVEYTRVRLGGSLALPLVARTRRPYAFTGSSRKRVRRGYSRQVLISGAPAILVDEDRDPISNLQS
jgi:hypothetical protein